ncbi:MAG TPA: M1 family aminopeptidase [Candidatus Limnocylindrales bacterium]|nr:M1 family aminopeptidase [Candidatus Limnocylindrales bacterium]
MKNRRSPKCGFVGLLFLLLAAQASGQTAAPNDAKQVYDSLKTFQLGGGVRTVENLVFKRDRAEFTFISGTIYFALPVAGRVEGAVFIGEGKFTAAAPPVKFEQESIWKLLHADHVETDFKTAVLRFSDDTFSILGTGSRTGAPLPAAQKLAGEFESRVLKETGANIPARLAVSLLNNEQPGFFMAEIDKGHRGRVVFLMDPQERIPSQVFRINGGEKGLIYGFVFGGEVPQVWTAFYSEENYAKGTVEFSDFNDQITIRRHDMDIDMHDPANWLKYDDRIELEVLQDGLRAIQLSLNEDLGPVDEHWLKDALRVKSFQSEDGKPVEAIQEDRDSTVTLLFPLPVSRGQKLVFKVRLEGEHMIGAGASLGCFFPLTSTWYLHHGYLQRSTFRMVFHHRKRDTPVALGVVAREEPESNGSGVVTEWKMDAPTPFVQFAVGIYKRYDTSVQISDRTVPISFYELIAGLAPVKSDFVAAEMGNSLRYYSALFSPFAYDNLHAVYHYQQYAQGLATMLLLPAADQANKFTFAFIAHEVAHQWWGNMVAWRSYRDQWLSEGFAEYCAILYTGHRYNAKARQDIIDLERDAVRRVATLGILRNGLPSDALPQLGPIILGFRQGGSYQSSVYYKGALILRMLHFLFTDPATQDDKPFFDMMREFVQQNLGKAVSTEDFMAFAGQRFAATPIARKNNLANLDWFFQQWVYEPYLPSYRLEYHIENQAGGGVLLNGTLYQEDLPENEKWIMPLPLVFTFGKDKVARGTILAVGPKTPISIKLASAPDKVELDPEFKVISMKMSAQREH